MFGTHSLKIIALEEAFSVILLAKMLIILYCVWQGSAEHNTANFVRNLPHLVTLNLVPSAYKVKCLAKSIHLGSLVGSSTFQITYIYLELGSCQCWMPDQSFLP